MLVTNVQSTTDPSSSTSKDGVQKVSSSGYIVTLALTPAQSERFVFATEFGHVWLSNEPATVSEDGTVPHHPGQHLLGGEVMADSVIYAPARSSTTWLSAWRACPSR